MLCFKEKTLTFSAPTAELPTTVTDLSLIAQLYQRALCPQCKSASLQLFNVKNRNRAYAVFLELRCTSCEQTLSETESYTSKQTQTDQSMEINRRAVLTGLTVGLGHAGLMKISEGLDMPSMHEKTWCAHFTAIAHQTDRIKSSFLDQAREKVREYYRQAEPDAFDDEGILTIGVSYDGSWAKRGHTSKIGAGAAIEIMTGLVIDFHVMSSHCQLCVTVGESLRNANKDKYDEWLQGHQASGRCTKNHDGTAGYMEICGAMAMWGRSLNHGMRYTTFVGDGDAKTITAINNAKFYGSVLVEKEECLNHVAKRLNAGLRKLVASMSKLNVRLRGHKKGSLTAVKIGMLQSYYTSAVRTYNSSEEVMSKAIWAAFYRSVSTADQPQHENCPAIWAAFYRSVSTADQPQHENCPVGEESWCWYQRALWNGALCPTEPEREQSTFLNNDVAPHVKKVYERLTDPALLGHCLLGKTQNSNQSLHSVIWAKCPKHIFSGLQRVKIGVTVAVGEYNMGSLGSHFFFRHLQPPLPPWARRETRGGYIRLRLPTRHQQRRGESNISQIVLSHICLMCQNIYYDGVPF
ncbi:hypothetical protein ElyMa_000139900 [Elysia marginata]|uniref:Mutator-like transposase domain-containing protein n=1 Tax=Elysia marginata TaxID=1093978 RepID=A0AAV4EPI9_9GAST|nr:hypothetical protein ElyMa_000139900 [Elysia marginata]